MRSSEITTVRVLSGSTRADALEVVAQVYRQEKRWIEFVEREIPNEPETDSKTCWHLARVSGAAAGVIRLTFDPVLEMPEHLGFCFEPGFDPERLRQSARLVDVGRFMILPRYRSSAQVSLALMRSAIEEVVERGYTHLLTDVFEEDPHSPLKFHTRVLGFERIATHRFGELACASRRIVLVLDMFRAYQRLKTKRDRVFRALTLGLSERLESIVPAMG